LAQDSSIPAGGFPTTRWSAVVGARSEDEALRRRSWDALVAAYWRPAYKHVRLRWRRSRDDAQDLVQAFFERGMEKDFFDRYDPRIARFRTFFRTCLDRHVGDDDKSRRRLKRGGGAPHLSLDFDAAEREIEAAASTGSADDMFDREWVRGLFTLAVAVLREECAAKGKETAFQLFERYDLSEPDDRPTYDALGRELGLTGPTVTTHLAYARRELRRLVLAKLEEITSSREELREEAKLLLGVDVG
jgi:RNA polymerase sigma factor (sigma-70 family)